jgi:hypothetical protein
MTLRVLFLGEGSSDNGLTIHVQRVATSLDVDIAITAPDLARLPDPPGRSVEAKLQAVIGMGGEYDLLVIHRDADNAGSDPRRAEIAQGVASCGLSSPHVAVVPVRMTEAWLLLDEQLIRTVAGNPNGRTPLDLPSPQQVEGLADPKAELRRIFAEASELRGRRLQTFKARFSYQRRQLLERLDPNGQIRLVPSWTRFMDDLDRAFRA